MIVVVVTMFLIIPLSVDMVEYLPPCFLFKKINSVAYFYGFVAFFVILVMCSVEPCRPSVGHIF